VSRDNGVYIKLFYNENVSSLKSICMLVNQSINQSFICIRQKPIRTVKKVRREENTEYTKEITATELAGNPVDDDCILDQA